MGKRIDFEQLKSMKDVRRERVRVRRDIELQEVLLKRDMDRFGEIFTVDYWMDILSRKAAELIQQATANVASRIRGIASGWHFVENLLSGVMDRFGRSRRVEEERYAEEHSLYDLDDEDFIDEDFISENRTC